LHFGARESRGSHAEVDFLIEIDGMPTPVEVKAGARGALKSMRLFLKEYPKTPLGIRYSMHELSYFDQILSIPLAELQIATQSPQIGIAKADLYPQFFLFGNIGWRSSDANSVSGQNSLGDIFSYKSLFWNAGPGFNWNILNYGRIRNSVRVEDARLQQLVVTYKNTVLNAQREVEDAMVAFTRSKEEERFLKDSVTAAHFCENFTYNNLVFYENYSIN